MFQQFLNIFQYHAQHEQHNHPVEYQRFRPKSHQKKILEDTTKGIIDILIGTHRILSSDINFHDLGLIIIDEEQ